MPAALARPREALIRGDDMFDPGFKLCNLAGQQGFQLGVHGFDGFEHVGRGKTRTRLPGAFPNATVPVVNPPRQRPMARAWVPLLRRFGPAPVLFRSLSSKVRDEGDKKWRHDTARGFAVMQVASQGSVARRGRRVCQIWGLRILTLNKWVQKQQPEELMSGSHQDVETENARLRSDALALKDCVANLTFETRLLKKT